MCLPIKEYIESFLKYYSMESLDTKINNIVRKHEYTINQTPSERRDDKLKELKSKLLKARSTYDAAPLDVELAEKDYYTLKEGPIGYEKRQLDKYKVEADKLKTELLAKHNEEMNETFQGLSYYNSQQMYSTNVNSVKLSLLKTIMNQLKELKKEYSEKSTNNRKTYYVLQEQESVTFWLQFLNYCLLSFIIVFIIYSVKEQHLDRYTYLFTIVGLVIVFYLEPLINLIRSIPLSFNVYTAWGEDTDHPTYTFYIVFAISIVLLAFIYKKNVDIDNYFQ